MIRKFIALIAALICIPAVAAPEDAVVRVASHGCSASVIYTEPGRSILLGCGHAYQGRDRNKAHVIDAPAPGGALAGRTGLISGNDQQSQQLLSAAKKPGKARVLKVDYQSDLSLIELPVGPLPYVLPVAPPGFRPGRNCVSCGYDRMDLQPGRARTWPATILTVEGNRTYTREKPWHGRSGGALLDRDAGLLIGVTHAYESAGPGSRGIFVSHAAICTFLRSAGWPLPSAAPVAPQLFQQMQLPGQAPFVPVRPGRVEIPHEMRIPNRTGSQCVWVSLATLAQFHRLARGAALASHGGLAGPGQPEGELRRLGIRYCAQSPPNRDATILRDALRYGYGAMVGLGGQHAVVAVALEGSTLTVIENMDPKLGTRTLPLGQWDGWCIVILPDGTDGAQAAPARPNLQAAPRPQYHRAPQSPQNCPGGG